MTKPLSKAVTKKVEINISFTPRLSTLLRSPLSHYSTVRAPGRGQVPGACLPSYLPSCFLKLSVLSAQCLELLSILPPRGGGWFLNV